MKSNGTSNAISIGMGVTTGDKDNSISIGSPSSGIGSLSFQGPIDEVIIGKVNIPDQYKRVIEGDTEFVILVTIPDFELEELSVKVDTGDIVVVAEKKGDDRNIFGIAKLEDTFSLSRGIVEDKVVAVYGGGILRIQAPIVVEDQVKTVTVEKLDD